MNFETILHSNDNNQLVCVENITKQRFFEYTIDERKKKTENFFVFKATNYHYD